MLAIGRALMARPKLLLLDEPSLGLSPLLTREIFHIMSRINDETGTTILSGRAECGDRAGNRARWLHDGVGSHCCSWYLCRAHRRKTT